MSLFVLSEVATITPRPGKICSPIWKDMLPNSKTMFFQSENDRFIP